jgi:lipopolysaccharide export system protein LptA
MNSRALSGLSVIATMLLATFSGICQGLEEDKEQPIQIVADKAVRDEQAGETRYEGNVILTQGSLQIISDQLIIYHDQQSADVIVAIGSPATLVQQPAPEQSPVAAEAERIEYIRSEDLIRLLNNARVEQDGSILSGKQIDYLVTERKVRAAGAADGEGESRVEVVIPPENLRGDAQSD